MKSDFSQIVLASNPKSLPWCRSFWFWETHVSFTRLYAHLYAESDYTWLNQLNVKLFYVVEVWLFKSVVSQHCICKFSVHLTSSSIYILMRSVEVQWRHSLITFWYNIICMFLHLQAPEELCAHARSLQLDWRFLQQILKLYSAVLQETQKEAELLHASDQKGNQYAFLLVEKSFFSWSFL